MYEILLIEMNSFVFYSSLQKCLTFYILKIVLDIHILLWKSIFQKYSCEKIKNKKNKIPVNTLLKIEIIWKE